ncbi:hypothetical protein FB45DRAFT_977865 [Roridomyces roridus]|uniref:T6SS Phospholipase effector Tle1-like catalytic domain-containing protein n=1 Tax=Roridomyces roridus TaxID=1738132 RepID=A0AAD7BZM4_9AGAR|nr:hypothetical protein FB45DRAFT_977865 [Roridomyces roridus]
MPPENPATTNNPPEFLARLESKPEASRKCRFVSIDGTSNQFGLNNTNVVELHSYILADHSAEQRKYYNSGIGTYVPHQEKFKSFVQQIDNAVELAFAGHFKEIILKAYRWLSETYMPNDKIFLFGFSRGAYQVRTLAGMIQMVGLVGPGNEELIPFAYEIYSERHKGRVTKDSAEIADNFKKTFSRDVRIHFVGVWDTVSSVGIIRKPLPLTMSANHVCSFRHALALDERRVKFLPEYVKGGSSMVLSGGLKNELNTPVDIKEVWFAGTHSDMRKNLALNLSSVPLLWMENEAISAGLRLRPRVAGGAWNMEHLQDDYLHESLTWVWKPLEYLPLTHLSFETADKSTM